MCKVGESGITVDRRRLKLWFLGLQYELSKYHKFSQ
jgi:hypothetical protein